MKRTLISILCILSIISASGQKNLTEDFTVAQSPINVALDEVNKAFTPPQNFDIHLKSGASNCNFNVTYINFPEEAKVAFEYAVSIWEKYIISPVEINLHANWEQLSPNELAHGKPSLFYRNYKGAPLENVYYPVALVEALSGKEYNSTKESDITCSFNKSKSWYFGTDGRTPVTQYDFVTAVLHEIGHGLGISGFFTSENGVGQYSNSSNSPSVYDNLVFNKNNERISDKSLFPIPSVKLTEQLTSNSLVFNYLTEEAPLSKIAIYAPSSFVNGLSIYHLTNNGNSGNKSNELMKAHSYKGEAIHYISAQTLQILAELGWIINSIPTEEIEKSAQYEKPFENKSINIYPNPFSGSLTFDCEDISDQPSLDIKITDLAGSIVYRETKNDIQYNPKLKVDLSDIKPGIYLASLTDNNFKTITKRIIKN